MDIPYRYIPTCQLIVNCTIFPFEIDPEPPPSRYEYLLLFYFAIIISCLRLSRPYVILSRELTISSYNHVHISCITYGIFIVLPRTYYYITHRQFIYQPRTYLLFITHGYTYFSTHGKSTHPTRTYSQSR